MFSDAALAVAMTDALSLAVPILDDGPVRMLFIVAVFGFLAGINIVGLRSAMRLMIVSTIGKLVPLLLLGMIISIFGSLSGDVLNTPRVIYSSARDELLPGILARVHPKFKTPYVAILFYATDGCGLALTGTFRELIVVATGAILLVYLGVSLSVIVMRRRHGPPAAGQFRIAGGSAVPLLSSAVIIWILVQKTRERSSGRRRFASRDRHDLWRPENRVDVDWIGTTDVPQAMTGGLNDVSILDDGDGDPRCIEPLHGADHQVDDLLRGRCLRVCTRRQQKAG